MLNSLSDSQVPMIFALPISDDNSEGNSRFYQNATHYALIWVCILVFCYKVYLHLTQGQAGLEAFVKNWSFDPQEYLGADYLQHSVAQRFTALLSCLAAVKNKALLRMAGHVFLQGSFVQLFFNMVVLWMLGDNVQYAMGQPRYLAFFLLTGLLGSFGAALFSVDPLFIGGAGGTGAVMAVAAAYMVYFPAAQINVFYIVIPFWIGVTGFPARLVIALYAATQAVIVWLLYGEKTGLAAVISYMLGFVWGALLAWPFRRNWKEALRQPVAREPYRKTIKEYVRERRDDHWGHGH